MMQHSLGSTCASRIGAGGLAIADFYIFPIQRFNDLLAEAFGVYRGYAIERLQALGLSRFGQQQFRC